MVSAALMKDLLKGGGEFGKDLLLQALVESAPDGAGGAGHGTAHSWIRASRSSRAVLVSLVRGVEAQLGARLVDRTGRRSRMKSR
jgi:hypothetical protein